MLIFVSPKCDLFKATESQSRGKKINYTKIKQRLWLCWYLLYYGFLKFIPELGRNHLTANNASHKC